MWLLIGVMVVLLLLPMAFAAVVYLTSAAWRFLEALIQGTVGALRLTWRAACWLVRAARWALRTGRTVAHQLREWHYGGSTWAGQYLQSAWLAWSNMARRRYVAGQLRRLRRERMHK